LNFKLLFIVFLLTGCGVKSVPRFQQEQAINSYVNKHAGIVEKKDKEETSKESKKDKKKSKEDSSK
jgi:hypothetical protein